ncbi:hypothetical protein HAX54_019708, partial [Datura stramonium]|nr:hypothetical protein [Datura stramonium]
PEKCRMERLGQVKWLQATTLKLCSIGASQIMIGESPMSHRLPLKLTCVLLTVNGSSAFRGSPSMFCRCLADTANASHFRNSHYLSSNGYNSLFKFW